MPALRWRLVAAPGEFRFAGACNFVAVGPQTFRNFDSGFDQAGDGASVPQGSDFCGFNGFFREFEIGADILFG